MSARSLAGAFQIGIDILRSVVSPKTKKILIQTGRVGSTKDGNSAASTEAENVEWWQHVGFASRPSKATPGRIAAQAFVVRQGSNDVALGSQDLRGLELYGQLKDGETSIYAAGEEGTGQARILLKTTGSINLYTRKGNVEDGAGMGVFIDPVADTISILNSKGYGLLITADGAFLTSGDAACSVEASGDCSLVGKGKCQIDGESISVGSSPAMNPAINAAIIGPTGVAGKASLKVTIE